MTENTATPQDEAQPSPDADDEAKASPKPSDEGNERTKEEMAEIDAKYDPGARKTVIVPGTNGMVTGTAFDGLVDSEDDFAGAAHDEARDQ